MDDEPSQHLCQFEDERISNASTTAHVARCSGDEFELDPHTSCQANAGLSPYHRPPASYGSINIGNISTFTPQLLQPSETLVSFDLGRQTDKAPQTDVDYQEHGSPVSEGLQYLANALHCSSDSLTEDSSRETSSLRSDVLDERPCWNEHFNAEYRTTTPIVFRVQCSSATSFEPGSLHDADAFGCSAKLPCDWRQSDESGISPVHLYPTIPRSIQPIPCHNLKGVSENEDRAKLGFTALEHFPTETGHSIQALSSEVKWHGSASWEPSTSSPCYCTAILDITKSKDQLQAKELLSNDGTSSVKTRIECSGSRSRRDTVQVYQSRRDELLIRLRQAGLSYKDIKERGHYRDAESTLRGRFRTLTKRKEERVRKPQWHKRDVSDLSQTC